MNNEMINIENNAISVKEYNGQRVVTFKDIDTVHERPDGTARKAFWRNKEHFIEGEDYFVLEMDEAQKAFNIAAPNGLALITEQGYLMLVKPFTDDLSWRVQRKLVSSYFKVQEITNTQLSPELQMLQGLLNQMVQKEMEDKERDRKIALLSKTTENIKEAVKPISDNWREEINSKFNRIQRNSDKPFNVLRTEMYSKLERRGGCDLGTRLRNKRNRMRENGRTKTEINNLNKMDIIEEDKRLKEIFSKIVSEYEISYCA